MINRAGSVAIAITFASLTVSLPIIYLALAGSFSITRLDDRINGLGIAMPCFSICTSTETNDTDLLLVCIMNFFFKSL